MCCIRFCRGDKRDTLVLCAQLTFYSTVGGLKRCLLCFPMRAKEKHFILAESIHYTRSLLTSSSDTFSSVVFCLYPEKQTCQKKKKKETEKIIVACKLSSQMLLQIKVQTSWKILNRPNYRCARGQLMKLFWIITHIKDALIKTVFFFFNNHMFYDLKGFWTPRKGGGGGLLLGHPPRFCTMHASLLSGDPLPRDCEKHLSINGNQ